MTGDPVLKYGMTFPVSLELLRDAGLYPPATDPSPGAWWTPLWPWRIGRSAQTRWHATRERIGDVAHVARHGIPEVDDY